MIRESDNGLSNQISTKDTKPSNKFTTFKRLGLNLKLLRFSLASSLAVAAPIEPAVILNQLSNESLQPLSAQMLVDCLHDVLVTSTLDQAETLILIDGQTGAELSRKVIPARGRERLQRVAPSNFSIDGKPAFKDIIKSVEHPDFQGSALAKCTQTVTFGIHPVIEEPELVPGATAPPLGRGPEAGAGSGSNSNSNSNSSSNVTINVGPGIDRRSVITPTEVITPFIGVGVGPTSGEIRIRDWWWLPVGILGAGALIGLGALLSGASRRGHILEDHDDHHDHPGGSVAGEEVLIAPGEIERKKLAGRLTPRERKIMELEEENARLKRELLGTQENLENVEAEKSRLTRQTEEGRLNEVETEVKTTETQVESKARPSRSRQGSAVAALGRAEEAVGRAQAEVKEAKQEEGHARKAVNTAQKMVDKARETLDRAAKRRGT